MFAVRFISTMLTYHKDVQLCVCVCLYLCVSCVVIIN